MKITKADVGRTVKFRNGKTAKLKAMGRKYLTTEGPDATGYAYESDGRVFSYQEDAEDIVGFVGKREKRVPDLTATPSQYAKRPLKANGQAFRFAKALLQGRKLTHQDFVRLLERAGIVSNSPQRRMSEARKWLRNRGIAVQFKLEGKKNPQHKRWFIAASAKASKLLTEMKGYA